MPHLKLLAPLAALLFLAACSPSCPSNPRLPPAPTFHPLFDNHSLANWKGLVADPPTRAKMSPAQLAAAQSTADQRMRDHWRADERAGGILTYDGNGDSICTATDYTDFEMLVDWKIEKGGDSGIYLRGSPQVQIWDNPLGSGGLYNNQKNPANPLVVADNPIGQWNTFRIRMIGDRVTVWLNNTLVTDNVLMENYWQRDQPIYPSGQIELQNHSSPLQFRNFSIRDLK